MTDRMATLGLAGAVMAGAVLIACQNTARGIEQDAREGTAKAKVAAQDAAERVSEDAKQAAQATQAAAARASSEAEQKSREAADHAGDVLDAAAQTMQIKTALIADKSVDASGINVDSDAATKTVTLNGHVATAAQRTAAEQIAKSKAPDYTVVNKLVVGS
jgi:osmotically-inducible protein OsmY